MPMPIGRYRVLLALLALSAAGAGGGSRAVHGQESRVQRLSTADAHALRAIDAHLDRMLRAGTLQVRLVREDTLLPGRMHTRLSQMVDGVPVYGGDVTRQADHAGVTLSVFGTLYEGINIATEPGLSADQVQALMTERTGVELGPERRPKLMILPRENGSYVLVYTVRVATPEDLTLYFVDAHTGAVIDQRTDAHRQSASVGVGVGVLGERKKVSTSAQAGTHVTSDRLRPPVIETYDMRGNLARTLAVLNGRTSLGPSDLASDADNDWTDGANVDAHVFAGYTYDYYFKRFGRRGLDNANIRIRSLTHPVSRQDVFTASPEVLGTFYVNAFYAGDGLLVYGEGLPGTATLGGQRWNFLAGSLDVVAHELTHGVTDYSSSLIYSGEAGALNEAFSDIMASAVMFYFQGPGTGAGVADYVVGNDVVTPGGIRSMENPLVFGDPDHYRDRYRGPLDNGGVHINSTIASHAYYLAIEGGTNRTSGLSVEGVGAANREQMEKVFYRAFTQLLPSNATFAMARETTVRAAEELYGSGSAVQRALVQAWTAVGVD